MPQKSLMAQYRAEWSLRTKVWLVLSFGHRTLGNNRPRALMGLFDQEEVRLWVQPREDNASPDKLGPSRSSPQSLKLIFYYTQHKTSSTQPILLIKHGHSVLIFVLYLCLYCLLIIQRYIKVNIYWVLTRQGEYKNEEDPALLLVAQKELRKEDK